MATQGNRKHVSSLYLYLYISKGVTSVWVYNARVLNEGGYLIGNNDFEFYALHYYFLLDKTRDQECLTNCFCIIWCSAPPVAFSQLYFFWLDTSLNYTDSGYSIFNLLIFTLSLSDLYSLIFTPPNSQINK